MNDERETQIIQDAQDMLETNLDDLLPKGELRVRELLNDLLMIVGQARSKVSQPNTVNVPVELIEAVANVGNDFGYGPYELEERHIKAAQELINAKE